MHRDGSIHRNRRTLCVIALAAGLAAPAAQAFTHIEAALAVEPSVARIGMTVNVTLTITNTGGDPMTLVNPFLSITSGDTLVSLASVPWQSASAYLGLGMALSYTWTLSVLAQGTVNLTGWAAGYVNGQPTSFTSTAILVIPGPTSPAIRILNNVLRPGKTSTIVLHGTPGRAISLVVHDGAGRPLGPIGLGAVALDAAGNGSFRFDGTVDGKRLDPGVYWIVTSGSASAKAPVLVSK